MNSQFKPSSFPPPYANVEQMSYEDALLFLIEAMGPCFDDMVFHITKSQIVGTLYSRNRITFHIAKQLFHLTSSTYMNAVAERAA